MAPVKCGGPIRLQQFDDKYCTSGCLVRYRGQPNKVLLLSVCHGLVGRHGKPGDVIVRDDSSSQRIGLLDDWTTLKEHGVVAADAALIWIDPKEIQMEVGSAGRPKGASLNPDLDSEVFIFAGGVKRRSTIDYHSPVSVEMEGPDGWKLKDVVYKDQIICASQFSKKGDSGAIALDKDNRIVGMVVALTTGAGVAKTVLTPIRKILRHDEFSDELEILTDWPAKPVSPW